MLLRPSTGARLVSTIIRSQCQQQQQQQVACLARRTFTATTRLRKEEGSGGDKAPAASSSSASASSPASKAPITSSIASAAAAAAKLTATGEKKQMDGQKPDAAKAQSSETATKKPSSGSKERLSPSKVAAKQAAAAAAGQKTKPTPASRANEEDDEEEITPRRRKMRFGRPSRYQVRHPRYYKGPLHPHQPPHPSDPSARVFIPGPFQSERLWDHYNDTLRADIMAVTYAHFPPGFEKKTYENRLRKWVGDSPYFLNRPLRPPRGTNPRLLPVHRPITPRNIPKLEYIVVHSFIPFAQQELVALIGGGLALQAITGVRAKIGFSKVSVTQWNFSKYKPCSLILKIEGPQMYRFLANCIDIVMPRIREFQGIDTRGDGKGTVMWGFTPDDTVLFPEIEVNIDSYPLKYIPGFDVHCVTSATNDYDAMLLMSSFGLPMRKTDVVTVK